MWIADINRTDSKLRTYSLLKKDISTATYLHLLNNREEVKLLSHLRLSCHKLQIELGRHKRPKVPVENRICMKCNASQIEDEIHFITSCNYYNTERRELFSAFIKHYPAFETYSNTNKFVTIFNTDDQRLIRNVIHYIKTCYNKHEIS